MISDHDMLRVARWLEESRATLPPPDPGRVLPRVLERVPAIRQRRARWWPAGIRPTLTNGTRSMLATASAVVAAFVVGLGALVLIPSDGGQLGGSTSAPGPRLGGLAYALDGDIFVADWDGTNPVRLADGVPEDGCGSFVGNAGLVSPDGRHIAYRSWGGDDCPATIYVSDPEGGGLATFPGVGWQLAWSPDSRFVATWLDDGKTIGVYATDGTLAATLDGSRMCCGDYDPAWSPDGTASLLVKSSGWQSTVWEIPLDGSPPREVPQEDPRATLGSGWRPRSVAYSPDGTRAVFRRPPATGDRGSDALVLSAADGTGRSVLVGRGLGADDIRDPLWSPAGDRIAFVLDRGFSRLSELRIADVASGGVATPPLASAEGSGSLELLGFSPEGDRVLFSRRSRDGASSLWSVMTDGSEERLLVEGTDMGGWLTKAPDA